MDFDKLSKVTDSVTSTRSNHRSVQSISSGGKVVEEEESILDSLDLKEKITDSVRVKKERTKFIILDNASITKITKMKRSDRTRFLSRLSDSQRRKVLSMIHKSTTHVKDAVTDEEPENIASSATSADDSALKLHLDIANVLMNNAALTQSDYSLKTLKEFAEKELTSTEEKPIKELANLIADQEFSFESKSDKEVLKSALDIFSEYGVDSDVEANLSIATAEPTVMDDSAKLQILKEGRRFARKVFDGMSISEIEDSVDAIIGPYTVKGYEYDDVKSVFDSGFNSISKNIFNQKVRDSVIDSIADNPAYDEDGNEIKNEEDKSVLEALQSALVSYADGDDSELQKLASTDLKGNEIDHEDEEPKDGEDPKDDDPEGDEKDSHEGEDNKDEDHKDEEPEGEELEDEDSKGVKDSVSTKAISLAKALLNKDASVNKIIDDLRSEVPALSKYEFRISDCILEENTIATPEIVSERPLNINEFNKLYQIPAYIKILAHENAPECPHVNSIETEGQCIKINTNELPQTWIPITGSVDDIMNEIGTDMDVAQSVITDKCVLVEDAMKIAAKTDNLAFIDPKFYKRKLSDKNWTFDEIPTCVKVGDEEIPSDYNCVYPSYADIPKDVPCMSVLIYGQEYKLTKKI